MSKISIDISGLIRRDLEIGHCYEPARPVHDGYKLDCNESPFNLPDSLRRRLIEWLKNDENLNRYPDSDNTSLREAIAGLWGVSGENITCGVGSDQIIDMVCRVFLEPGERVVIPTPAFGMYAEFAALNHGRVCEIPIGDGGGLAGDVVSSVRENGAKVVFLCSPNNPTGAVVPQDCIRFVLENAGCIVVVDEAYGEFSGSTMIPFIDEYPNMIVIKTYSKVYGLAGARVGYAVAAAGTIGAVDIARPPFNLPTISQLLAEWAISESSEFSRRAEILKRSRDALFADLSRIPNLRVRRSETNFLYVESDFDAAAVLAEHGIAIKRYPREGSVFRSRISVGSEVENRKVSEALWSVRPE
jgi:histidinol-phosphate aminotransferase